MSKSWRFHVALIASSILLFVAGCAPTTIAGLEAKGDAYDGRTVTITARVIETRDIPLTDTDYYKITDDSGDLWVVTTRGVPLSGLKYRITGTYEKPAGRIGGIVFGEHILREQTRTEVR